MFVLKNKRRQSADSLELPAQIRSVDATWNRRGSVADRRRAIQTAGRLPDTYTRRERNRLHFAGVDPDSGVVCAFAATTA